MCMCQAIIQGKVLICLALLAHDFVAALRYVPGRAVPCIQAHKQSSWE
jgi:hypothetical protein